MPVDLSIVIVSYNSCDLLRGCLESLPAATDGLDVEVFVVDNASSDGSVAMVETQFPTVHVLANGANVGFAAANNQALRISSGRNALILNPDTEPAPGSLTLLSRCLDEHAEVGAAGPKLLNSDGTLQRNGRLFPTPWREFLGHSGLRNLNRAAFDRKMHFGRDDFDIPWETDEVSGACLMTRRSVMDEVGLLDERFFMFYEEIEWCRRIRAADYKVMYLPDATVTHHWMGSVRAQTWAMTMQLYRSALLYYRKTAGPGAQATMRIVMWIGWLRMNTLRAGVAVKARLRAWGWIR